MWRLSTRLGGGDHNDDVESIFDVEDEFPVTCLRPRPVAAASDFSTQKTNGASEHQHDLKLPLGISPAHYATLVKSSRTARIRWPGASDEDDSLPSETMSLSTISDSCLESVRDCIPAVIPAVKPEPISNAERQALNSLYPDGTTLPFDVELIMKNLDGLMLDDLLCDGKLDDFVERFPDLAPHVLRRHNLDPNSPSGADDCTLSSHPEVLPWLNSVEEPLEHQPFAVHHPTHLDDPASGDFSFHADEFTSHTLSEQAQHPQALSHMAVDPSLQCDGPKRDRGLAMLPCISHEHSKEFQLILPDFGKVDTLGCGSTTSPSLNIIGENDQSDSKSLSDQSCDDDSKQSFATDYLSEENIASIGIHAIEQLFGPNSEDSLPWSMLEEAVQTFIDDLVNLKHGSSNGSSQFTSLSDGTVAQGDSSLGSSSGGSSLKRKTVSSSDFRSGKPEYDDEGSSGGPSRRGNGKDGPLGKDDRANEHRKNGRLEFMCPFRLKDPVRFNVREWYDCATKAYICEEPTSKRNELNELRRHIKQKHSGPGILSQPYCSTCKEEFSSPTSLDEHARRRICPYRELPVSNDPFDGLSPEAERALRSRQGRQGDTALNQYRQICQIVFGEGTEVPSPGYLPVIEHFELHSQHIESMPRLRDIFLRKLPFQLESQADALLDVMHIHAVDVFGQCNDRALTKATTHKRRKTSNRKHEELSRRSGHSADYQKDIPTVSSPAVVRCADSSPLLPKPVQSRKETNRGEPSSTPITSLQGITGETIGEDCPQRSSLLSAESSRELSKGQPFQLLKAAPSTTFHHNGHLSTEATFSETSGILSSTHAEKDMLLVCDSLARSGSPIILSDKIATGDWREQDIHDYHFDCGYPMLSHEFVSPSYDLDMAVMDEQSLNAMPGLIGDQNHMSISFYPEQADVEHRARTSDNWRTS